MVCKSSENRTARLAPLFPRDGASYVSREAARSLFGADVIGVDLASKVPGTACMREQVATNTGTHTFTLLSTSLLINSLSRALSLSLSLSLSLVCSHLPTTFARTRTRTRTHRHTQAHKGNARTGTLIQSWDRKGVMLGRDPRRGGLRVQGASSRFKKARCRV